MSHLERQIRWWSTYDFNFDLERPRMVDDMSDCHVWYNLDYSQEDAFRWVLSVEHAVHDSVLVVHHAFRHHAREA